MLDRSDVKLHLNLTISSVLRRSPENSLEPCYAQVAVQQNSLTVPSNCRRPRLRRPPGITLL